VRKVSKRKHSETEMIGALKQLETAFAFRVWVNEHAAIARDRGKRLCQFVFGSLVDNKCLLAKARPEPLFRYLSKFSARVFSGKAA
jgi:hypothetical protein